MSFYSAQRNHDFMRECHRQREKAFDEGRKLLTNEIIAHAINSTAPAYYVDHGYALRYVSLYNRNKLKIKNKKGTRYEMLQELSEKCQQLMAKQPGLSLNHALARVLTEGNASRYFITFHTARRLYFEIGRQIHRRSKRDRTESRRRSRKLF